MQTQGVPAAAAGEALHPTAAVAPQGVVTRQSVVPGPPIFVPQLLEVAADAERDSMVTMRGLAQAATTACLRNLRLERPSSVPARFGSLTLVPLVGPPHS